MNENTIQSRPYLDSYDLAVKIKAFFLDFIGDVSTYAYVSASERRCFNLAYTFFPKERKNALLSNSALLQYHQELTRYYVDNDSFPSILLIDDLLVHGRGMSKFLYQLETLIEQDLLAWAEKDSGRARQFPKLYRMFRHRLIQAVDIFVFAQNQRPLLLDDRYRQCLKSQYLSSEKELHDLSWQLSDALIRWRQANTCFAYSERNEALWDRLMQKDEMQYVDAGDWKQIHWKYDGESMGIFLNFWNKQSISRISTIRFFPGRRKQHWFTSFTMLGAIPEKEMQHLGVKVADLLIAQKENRHQHIVNLLIGSQENTGYAIGQLLTYLLSAAEYRSFLKEILGSDYVIPDREWIQKNTDIDKICRNFGKAEHVLPSLLDILSSAEWMDAIFALLQQEIERSAEPLCPMPDQEIPVMLTAEQYVKYNEYIEQIFYKVGIDAEENAAKWFYNVETFRPSSFQKYSSEHNQENTGGMVSVSDIFYGNILKESPKPKNLYFLTAALVHVMDYGLMGIRVGDVDDTKYQTLLCKAGEMATFYGPKKIAVAIPALAMLERSYRGGRLTPRILIEEFVDSLSQQKIQELVQVNEPTWEKEYQKEFENLKQEILRVTKELYRGDQRYADWDFENLTLKHSETTRRFQRALQYLANLRIS